MPETTEATKAESRRKIRANLPNSAAYPHPGHSAIAGPDYQPAGRKFSEHLADVAYEMAAERLAKRNGLPRGWRRSNDNETVWRKRHGWLCVVRTSQAGESGPFVALGRQHTQDPSNSGWFRWEGHRTLEDAMAKADEVMG